MILDTTFLVDVLRGADAVASQLEAVDASGSPHVSTVSVMELSEGIGLSSASCAEREGVESLLSAVHEIPFDRKCAVRAGRISADLIQNGEPIVETDVMIAATALETGYPVVTRNVEHFDRINDLDVVSY